MEEENELVDFLIEYCKMGNGKTKMEILQTVKRLVEKKELTRSYPYPSSMVKAGGQG